MNKLIMIAAVGKNGELGYKNDLIWHIKEDMKFFKEKTINHHVLMGKNTFLSLPKLLPLRTHLVLSKSAKENDFPKEVILLRSIDEFYEFAKNINDDVYVIGGANVYKEMINDADLMYLTEIDEVFNDADAYFPFYNHDDYERVIIKENEDNNPKYKHVLYKKKDR